MSNRQLPELFARALNEQNIELFNEFIHPQYDNHNPFVAPGIEGVKAFFTQWLASFPDTRVSVEDVIEDGDRVCARFTYRGTFTCAFMGYPPNHAAIEMRSIDIWRIRDNKFIEHWDELNTLDVFQKLGAAMMKSPASQ